MRNRFLILVILSFSSSLLFAQDKNNTAPNVKTFGLQPDQIGDGSSTVNLFTGDVSFPVNLVSLPGRNGLDVAVNINYNSSVSNIVSTWNLEAPTGIVGLGWSMDFPKIVRNNRQTGTIEDDEYYLVEGGSSNRLVRTKSGIDGAAKYYEYESKNLQFWKIKFYYDPIEKLGTTSGGSGSNKWVITRENGTRYVYGDKNSGRNTIQYLVRWDNWIGNSTQATGQSQLANAWNLSETIGIWGDKIVFEYDNVEQFVGSASGLKHTEASYLKQITDVIGRKVQFFYNLKGSQYFAEPHTEKVNEPDAYQEVYETKYLDHIDVLEELGSKFLTVNLAYGSINDGTSTAKMLLTSIEQRNANSNALPKMKFDYITGNVATKGFLQSVTYPTGGKIIYEYSSNQIGHSARELEIRAPTGFAESMVWWGEDYVVVAWRKLGSNGKHDDGPQEVRLYAYQWVGEWKEQALSTMSGVTMPYCIAGGNCGNVYMEYENFQVVTQANFFSVLNKSSGNNYSCRIYFKDESQRGNWLTYIKSISVDEVEAPKLLSGDHFIAVAPFRNRSSYPTSLFTYNGNSWTESTIRQGLGDSYHTSTNNYFINQNRISTAFNFNYLSEDRTWITKALPLSLTFTSDHTSYWYGSSSMALVMADDNPEYVYRWDLNYSSFFRDSKDVNNTDLFGLLEDTSPVSILNNNSIAVMGNLARFDGKYWYKDYIDAACYYSLDPHCYSYGEDMAVRPVQKTTGNENKGSLKIFNPNVLQWLPDVDMSNSSIISYAGVDYYYYGNTVYYKQPDGQWIKKPDVSWMTPGSWSCEGGYPRYEIWSGSYPSVGVYFSTFKNGVRSETPIGNYGSFNRSNLLKAKGAGNSSFVLFKWPSGTYDSNPRTYSSTLKLFRQVSNAFQGKQIDYSVSLVTVVNADKAQYTKIDYNLQTAVMDPSGTTAQYNEVTVIPGSNSFVNRPNGYAKTFFNNGLGLADLYDAQVYPDMRWLGASYESRIYDALNNQIAYSKTTYTTVLKDMLNNDGIKVQVGAYVRPTSIMSMKDGIVSTTTNAFDVNTGLLTQSSVLGANTTTVVNKYFWEVYDPTRALNILSPLVFTKKIVNGVTTDASAVRFKSWPSFYSPSGIYDQYDQYYWTRSGSSDFSTWDTNTTPPITEWRLMSTVSARETYTGMAHEVVDNVGRISCTLFDGSKFSPKAVCSNASLSDVTFDSFESWDNNNTRNGNFAWTDGSIVTASPAKTGSKCFSLGINGITKAALNASTTYRISFWAISNGGAGIVNGVSVDFNSGDWKYFEFTLAGQTSSNIKRSGSIPVFIDEVRLYPINSDMTTFTYHPIYGLLSQTDLNNQSSYRDYDEWGRIKTLSNDDRDITKTFYYNFKN